MTSIELRTRAVYDSLSPAEKKVAAYFLGHVENVFHMPIAALAEAAGVSQVAWVRFSKTVGFYGLKDLKKQLFSELNAQSDPHQPQQETPYTDISGHSTVGEMVDTVRNCSIQAIEDTLRLLDPQVVQDVAARIIRADSVKLFGVGASALVAADLYDKPPRRWWPRTSMTNCCASASTSSIPAIFTSSSPMPPTSLRATWPSFSPTPAVPGRWWRRCASRSHAARRW